MTYSRQNSIVDNYMSDLYLLEHQMYNKYCKTTKQVYTNIY